MCLDQRTKRWARKPKLILFDLDGTLVDSIPDLAYSIDAMLEQLRMSPHGVEKVKLWVGNGAERLVKRALTGGADEEPDQRLFQGAFAIFSDSYAQNTCRQTRLYPGVREGIDYLLQAGYALGCITNKRQRFTRPLLGALGLLSGFSVVVSGDSLAEKKPSPEPLLYAALNLGVSAEDSLMVGDSINDVLAARAARMPIIGVRYGYNHGEDITQARPDYVLDSLAELQRLL
ncbi:MAG: phosphoglycolate phosphatase [Gammaproteobacteria bacterium]